MAKNEATRIEVQLSSLDPSQMDYATQFVDLLLDAASQIQCSDLHLQPSQQGLEVRWRLDGVLQPIGIFAPGEASDVVTRLKVLAELLTYRTDIPQEGRIRRSDDVVEMRVSTFPTVFGERLVIRFFAAAGELLQLSQLDLPVDVSERLGELLQATSGALLVTGPAGAGKTTTAYACLRHLVAATAGGRSIVSLEDPVEVVVPGVAQSQSNPVAGFELHSGLKSLLRQDPEVLFVGEIRDKDTAEVAFQAALTGQLLVTTFHAGSAAEAISRLIDMEIEPYLLRSGLLGVVSQRLVRRLCSCAVECDDETELLGLPVSSASRQVGCPACGDTGYAGRAVIAELIDVSIASLGAAILARQESTQLESIAAEQGMISLQRRALDCVERRVTSPAEVRRVFGLQRLK